MEIRRAREKITAPFGHGSELEEAMRAKLDEPRGRLPILITNRPQDTILPHKSFLHPRFCSEFLGVQLRQSLQEQRATEGLGEISVHPGSYAPLFVTRHGMRGKCNYRYVRAGPLLTLPD